jgi:hypothetical protein
MEICSKENIANILLKIYIFITFNTIENISKDKKSFYNMFLYNIIAFFICELYKVILLGSQIGSGRDPYRGSRLGALANLAREL